jgi:5-oxoprolinase (ATP-hydrolysing) subunit A
MHHIDLNCDMGESFGAYTIGQDEQLMDYVSSANIACGFHGGDPSVMRRTVLLAAEKNVAIGAHPGYRDLEGFGRRSIKMSLDEIHDLVVYQVGALSAFAKIIGKKLSHVKAHGALYNAASVDSSIAQVIARAVRDIDPELLFVGLSGSVMITEAEALGLRTISEVFADRTYQDDGTLTPRTNPKAMVSDPAEAAQRVLRMVTQGTVNSVSGKEIQIKAQTVCIHGDSPHAVAFAKSIVALLKENNVRIQRP